MCVTSAVTDLRWKGRFLFWKDTPATLGRGFFFFSFFQCFAKTVDSSWQYYSCSLTAVLNSNCTQYFVFSLFACLYNSRLLYLYNTPTVFGLDAFCPWLWFQTGFLCASGKLVTLRNALDYLQVCTEYYKVWERLIKCRISLQQTVQIFWQILQFGS